MSKKSEIMLCPTCAVPNNITDVVLGDDELPSWLLKRNYVDEFINSQTEFKEYMPKNPTETLMIDVGKRNAGRYILFWAADTKTSAIVKDAKQAYKIFDNHGVTKVDAHGHAKVCIRCPQVYCTTPAKGKKAYTYNKHMHFCVSNKQNNKWLGEKVYTRMVICNLGFKVFENARTEGKSVIINALPCEYYGKDHIPNSWNLTSKAAKKISTKDLASWFKGLLVHYPKLHKLVESGKIKIMNIPIITYCAHKDCNASNMLAEVLLKKGFRNIDEYPGGMKEWNNMHKKC